VTTRGRYRQLRERVRDVAGSYTLGHGTILASGSPSMAAGLQGYSREANRRVESEQPHVGNEHQAHTFRLL
jgi:hypothetical protein